MTQLQSQREFAVETLSRTGAERNQAPRRPTIVLGAGDSLTDAESVRFILNSISPRMESSRRELLVAAVLQDSAIRSSPEHLAAAIRGAAYAEVERSGGADPSALEFLADVCAHEARTIANSIAYAPLGKYSPDAFLYPDPTVHAQGYRHAFDALPYARLEGILDRATPVISAGSCFASEIARYMQENGFNYVVTERYSKTGQSWAHAPAAWGKIFNAPGFRQLVERAFGEKETPRLLWQISSGGRLVYRDPFREEVEFSSVEEYERNYDQHLAAVREAILRAEVFILTLGLTEVWRLKADGSVLSRVPWRLSPATVEPLVLSVEENLQELDRLRAAVHRRNPHMRFIVSVSPVPLQATFRGDEMSAIAATTHSKGLLRTVAAEWSKRHDDVTYFPAYETVMTCSERPWQFDQRHVRRETVDKVMQLFERVLVRHPGVTMPKAIARAEARSSALGLFLAHLPSAERFEPLAKVLQTLIESGLSLRLVTLAEHLPALRAAVAPSIAIEVAQSEAEAQSVTDLQLWSGGDTEGERLSLRRARAAGLEVLAPIPAHLEEALRTALEITGVCAVVAEAREKTTDEKIRQRWAVLRDGYMRHLEDRKTPHTAYVAMRELSLTPAAENAEALHQAVACARPARPLAAAPNSVVGSLDAEKRAGILEDLSRDGFHLFERRLPEALVERLLAAGRNMPVVAVHGKNRSAEPAPIALQRTREPAATYTLDRRSLAKDRAVQELMADRGLLDLVQSSLGLEPVLDSVAMWWSLPHPGGPSSPSAQLFHHDIDRIRWLKFFVYLTDVDEQTGPHVFVKGTHRNCHPALCRDGRISDADVERHHRDSILRVNAPKGTMFLADTRALHKGSEVLHGERLIFQMEWATNLFGAPIEEYSWRALDPIPALESLRQSHPRVFLPWYGGAEGPLSKD